MANSEENRKSSRIAEIEPTDEQLTGRGGLAVFVRFLEASGLLDRLASDLSALRQTQKGLSVRSFLKQVLCFFMDGTSRHLTHFDRLAEDGGYAGATQTPREEMASSHQIKRLFRRFSGEQLAALRALLLELFLRRLEREEPEVIVLGLDSMIMDNDDAARREGATATYKNVKGFQPLQLTAGRFIVDAAFRPGHVHCNRGDEAYETVARVVRAIRDRGITAPIIVRMDAGFYDGDLMAQLDALEVGYLIAGRRLPGLEPIWELLPEALQARLCKEGARWRVADLRICRPAGTRVRRALYSRLEAKDGQYLLPLTGRTESIIYTNIERSKAVGRHLVAAGREDLLAPTRLLRLYHGRGRDEQVHRALKDFGFEALPFQRFATNAAFYYLMLVAFACYEAFKTSVCKGLVPERAYPTRLRRAVIDIAAKVVRTARTVRLKVPRAVFRALDLRRLWQRAGAPPPLLVG